MVSTLLGYKLYATDMSKSLERLEKTATVKKDTAYYNENIGKVTSVDEFLDDYRLYSYALKAYGLEDQIASKGLIRKVLESDLSDSTSFANKLTDKKYRTFAAAFSFGTNSSSETKVAQSSAQTESMVDSYTDRRIRQGTAAAAKTNYFKNTIGSIQTVDDLLNNTALYEVVLRSIGADPAATSHAFAKQALTNTLPNGTTTTSPIGWMKIHELFNFDANGAIKPPATAVQDAGDTNQLIYNYNVATDNNVNPASAAFNTEYFKSKIVAGAAVNVDTLLNDPRLFEYVATAFGFDPSMETPAFFKSILTNNDGAGTMAYNQLMASTTAKASRKEQFTNLRAVFNFNSDGSAGTGGTQTTAQQEKLEEAYFRNYTAVTTSNDTKQTKSFKFLMDKINSVTDLLMDKDPFGHDALNYALKAYDIDPDETSLFQVRRVLTSDVSDPNSYVNKLRDERFVKFAAAFNFGADGKETTQRLVQSTAGQTTTGSKYLASFGDDLSTAKKDLIKVDTKAYLAAIGTMTSLDDLLEDTKSLNFALKAYGLDDEKLSVDQVRKILTSDLSDRKSFANASGNDAYVEFAKAFNFTTTGTVRREDGAVQNGAAKLTTANEYLLQTLEQKASDEGQEGVRLALYFRRMAPKLTSLTGILADKALLETVKTALGLPDAFATLDTDKQLATLEKKLKLDDLKDPKTLEKFITRFSALYDVANPSTTGSASILDLFGGSSSNGVLGLF